MRRSGCVSFWLCIRPCRAAAGEVWHSGAGRAQVLPSGLAQLPVPSVKLLNALIKAVRSQLLRIDRLANRCLGLRGAPRQAPSAMRRFDDRVREAGVSRAGSIRLIIRRFLLVLAAVGLALLFVPEVASAQSWWPFGGGGGDEEEQDRPPVPREPVYRQPDAAPAPQPQQAPPPMAPASPGVPRAPGSPPPAAAPAADNYSAKSPICFQLEQRLVQEGQKSGQSRDELPRVEDEIRVARTRRSTQASRSSTAAATTISCSPRRSATRRSARIWRVRSMFRSGGLSDLDARRQDILGSSGRSYQDDIIRELARNNCGANYVDMARRSAATACGRTRNRAAATPGRHERRTGRRRTARSAFVSATAIIFR